MRSNHRGEGGGGWGLVTWWRRREQQRQRHTKSQRQHLPPTTSAHRALCHDHEQLPAAQWYITQVLPPGCFWDPSLSCAHAATQHTSAAAAPLADQTMRWDPASFNCKDSQNSSQNHERWACIRPVGAQSPVCSASTLQIYRTCLWPGSGFGRFVSQLW